MAGTPTTLYLGFQSDLATLGLIPGVIVRTYAPGVVVGDAVYQRADGLIDKADASSIATMPCIGIVEVLDSPAPGQCLVRYDGDLSVIPGLTAGKVYIVGTTPGLLVAEDDTLNPIYPTAVGEILQQIGVAQALANLFVRVSLFKIEL